MTEKEIVNKIVDYCYKCLHNSDSNLSKKIIENKIKFYKKNNGFTYNGIYFTLGYITNTCEKELSSLYDIIKYYDEARKFYDDKKRVAESAKNYKLPETIHVTVYDTPNKPRVKLKDITSIGEEIRKERENVCNSKSNNRTDTL